MARKRRNDPNKERSGAPIMVSSKTDIWANGFDTEDGKKYVKTVTNPETGRKTKSATAPRATASPPAPIKATATAPAASVT